ncbi:hypothetical protein [Hazenella coriacea]|uniref:Uncharacterized protein n=1 Tax=Hazenella coriacea TaxID=1179467 RepID=A0A4R3L6W0_9BACL|nr:hypothetical protein [Hazenella coriacea]TCS93944.1 hypothetical protein EDD58_105155 [Hazenella coriacea]
MSYQQQPDFFESNGLAHEHYDYPYPPVYPMTMSPEQYDLSNNAQVSIFPFFPFFRPFPFFGPFPFFRPFPPFFW